MRRKIYGKAGLRVGKRLLNNIGLKVSAVIISMILWLVVLNFNDPIITETHNGIEVKILNSNALDKQGKVYEVLDNTDIVNVTIRAARSVVDEIDREDVYAVADLSKLTYVNTLTIQVYTDEGEQLIKGISSSIESVRLHIEDGKSRQLIINPIITGKPANGYIQGDVKLEQNIVRMTGPTSLIDSIDRVEAVVDIKGMQSTINTSTNLILYDKSGAVIEDSNIKQNISEVTVGVEVFKTKEVLVAVETSGDVEEGYMLNGKINLSKETVTIAAPNSILKNLDSITIPGSAIEVDGASENLIKELNIKDYIPNGVMIAEDFDGKITVEIGIEAEETKVVTVKSDQIKVLNTIEGYDYKLNMPEELSVNVVGTKKQVGQVSASEIVGTIDLSEHVDMKDIKSSYRVTLNWNEPDNIKMMEIEPVYIKLTKKD